MNFLKKKTQLLDLLNGGVDIHNHILPGIDDGAKNSEESISLLKKYKELGITKIVATPHTMSDYYPNTPYTIQKALEKLQIAQQENELMDIEVKVASEYMIDPYFEEMIDNKEPLLTLANNHLLVEMSYLRISNNFESIIYRLQSKKYNPILAHPERYSYFLNNFDKYYALKKQGIKFQLNTLALTEHYGSKIQKVAKQLLKEGMYDFIGIDTHRIEHLEKVEKIKISKNQKEIIQQLLENNKTLF